MTPEEQVANALRTYGRPFWVAYIPMRVVKQVPYATLTALLAEVEPHTTGNEKRRIMLKWCDEHLFDWVTVSEVAEIMGVSNPTAKKFIVENPHRFRFVKRGTYEVRAD